MVRWSYTSKMDLLQIYSYISKDSVYYAKKAVNDIVDKSEYLAMFPNMGRMVEEIGEEDGSVKIFSHIFCCSVPVPPSKFHS